MERKIAEDFIHSSRYYFDLWASHSKHRAECLLFSCDAWRSSQKFCFSDPELPIASHVHATPPLAEEAQQWWVI